MKDFFNFNKIKKRDFFNPLSLRTSHGMPQISKHLLTVNSAFAQQRYVDLHLFRREMEESKAGLHHLPYTQNKKNTTFYKSIFYGFASLFFLLSVIAMTIPSALGCGFFFSSCTFLKGIIVSFCTFLSGASLTLAIHLRAEKEAVAHSIRKTKAHLTAMYARKKMSLGIKSFFSIFGPDRQKTLALKQLYHETYDMISDKKDETFHLVHQIITAETLDEKEKEDLLNQAIEEFNDKLRQQIHVFRHAPLPSLPKPPC